MQLARIEMVISGATTKHEHLIWRCSGGNRAEIPPESLLLLLLLERVAAELASSPLVLLVVLLVVLVVVVCRLLAAWEIYGGGDALLGG